MRTASHTGGYSHVSWIDLFVRMATTGTAVIVASMPEGQKYAELINFPEIAVSLLLDEL